MSSAGPLDELASANCLACVKPWLVVIARMYKLRYLTSVDTDKYYYRASFRIYHGQVLQITAHVLMQSGASESEQ